MQVIDDYLEEGLTPREIAERIAAETGMEIHFNTVYNWLRARELARQETPVGEPA
jgi:IS30 family transposase